MPGGQPLFQPWVISPYTCVPWSMVNGVPINSLIREGKKKSCPLFFWPGHGTHGKVETSSKLGRTDGDHFCNPGDSWGGRHTKQLRILYVWQWLWAKLSHFLQTQPHPQTFSGPKFLVQMFAATLTTFVPNMPLCGLKKIRDRCEEKRALFGNGFLGIVRALCASFRDIDFARENQNTSGWLGGQSGGEL